MNELRFRLRLALIVFLLTWLLFVIFWTTSVSGQKALLLDTSDSQYLTVAFLDVGQGDAIYIETFDGVQLLVDGGPNETVIRELGQQLPLFDRSLDIVLATHTDKDHIGGLVDVLERYQVENIIVTENTNDTAVARAFIEDINQEKAKVIHGRAGQTLLLGASTTLTIYSPNSNPESWESNAASIVAQLKYGDIEFMLTGDAPISIEEYLVKEYGSSLESEVLKLGHHGSRTSTADSFLDVVKPLYAVTSAGANNRYGHPHSEVVTKVSDREIDNLSTATLGTIVFKSDGEEVWLE